MFYSFIRETSPEINAYIDAVLQEVKKLIITLGIEPMPLPELIKDFEWTVRIYNFI
jgi:hypothetical protein